MAKRLSTGTHLRRAIDRGWTVDQLANVLGRSKGYVQKIVSGRAPAGNLFETARDLGKGKRSVTPPPASRQEISKARERGAAEVKRVERERRAKVEKYLESRRDRSALARAERQLDGLDGTDRYVIHVTSKKTGQSFTICRKGGVSPDTLRGAPSLADFIIAQGANQGYPVVDLDWADIVDISFEEYY